MCGLECFVDGGQRVNRVAKVHAAHQSPPRSSGAAGVALPTTPPCQAFALNTKLLVKATAPTRSCDLKPRFWQLFQRRLWFWTITAATIRGTIHSRGYSATREQAMQDFKAQWLS
jgi:hypothetical protein